MTFSDSTAPGRHGGRRDSPSPESERCASLEAVLRESDRCAPGHAPDALRRERHQRRRTATAARDSHGVRRRVRERRDLRTRPTVSTIIPALNEAENLPHVLRRLPAGVDELIVVDGNSTDATVAVARALRPDARVIMQTGSGKGNALACGFAAARGDILVMIDADGSTDPAEIPRFIAPLARQGADFVKGSRYLSGGGSADFTRLRNAGNRALGLGVNLMFGTRYTDLCYGYNAFWRWCLPHLHITCDGFEVETILNVRAARAGFRVVEVPSYEQQRISGLSNLNAWHDGKRVLRAILSERCSRLPDPGDAWVPGFEELSGELAASL